MTELLALLTVIFVVYSLYEVFKTACHSGGQAVQAMTSARHEEVAAPVKKSDTVAVAARQPSTAAPSSPTPTAGKGEIEKSAHLKDPSTGEVSPVPSNYRFAKKWIKEALVSEGLLTKVYKNSELIEPVNSNVKEALEKFKKLEKYQA